MTRRIALTGCFGFQNTGDDAIWETWLHELSVLPQVEVIAVGVNSVYLGPQYPGTAVLDWRQWTETIDVLASADLLIVAGGGLFHDYCPVEPFLFMEPTPLICPMTYLNLISWAKVLGRPCILTGVGVGPLKTEIGQTYGREVLRWADFITVRDTESRKTLQSIDLPEWDRVLVTADPVFRLPPGGRDQALAVLEATGLSLTRPVIGVVVRNWMRDPPMDRWGRALAEALRELVDATGGTVLFLPFQVYPPDEEANDITAAAAIQRWMGESYSVPIVSRYLTPSEADALIGACDAVIAMRLHALIMAIRNAVPCVGLAYDPKVRALMADAGLTTYTWDLAFIQSHALARQVLELLERPDGFRSTAIAYRDEAVERTAVHRQIVMEYLEGKRPVRRLMPPLWTSWVRGLWRDRVNRSVSTEPASLLQQIQALQAEAAELQARAAVERQALQIQLAQRDQFISSVTGSRVWLLVRFLWWLRPKVAPDGSWRQRFLYGAWRLTQTVLAGVRRWPRSLLRSRRPPKADLPGPQTEGPASGPTFDVATQPLAILNLPAGQPVPQVPSGPRSRKVFIMAPALWDVTGQTLYLGGAERYLLYLTSLLRDLGHEVQIYQPAQGNWERQFYGVPVHGVDTGGLDPAAMNEVFHQRFDPPDLTVYLDFTWATPRAFTPSVGISHGVFWDAPGFQHTDQYTSVLRSIENLSCVVSVDTNTINWVRTFSTPLAEKMVFIPNFVDLTVFRPRPAHWPKNPHTLVILYPRRLHPSRGLYLLQELIPSNDPLSCRRVLVGRSSLYRSRPGHRGIDPA
ncbi:MAG: polysaccharide pyruvyl transferase family protein [Acidobacteriota bacterium]|nr:polysaccharide pyruvyl transferase family protein [Acidobacteriota bacterium]